LVAEWLLILSDHSVVTRFVVFALVLKWLLPLNLTHRPSDTLYGSRVMPLPVNVSHP